MLFCNSCLWNSGICRNIKKCKNRKKKRGLYNLYKKKQQRRKNDKELTINNKKLSTYKKPVKWTKTTYTLSYTHYPQLFPKIK